MEDRDDGEELLTAVGGAQEHCKEAPQIAALIASLAQATDPADIRSKESQITNLLQKYQEQPHLLDPHLAGFIHPLLEEVRKRDTPQERKDSVFTVLYTFTKVRGYKTVIKTFSHEANEFQMVLEDLLAQDPADCERWANRYVLLLWLSMICLLPFHMSVFDTAPGTSSSLVASIIALCKKYLAVTDKARDAAAVLVARFVTRPDTKDEWLPHFLQWGLAHLESEHAHTVQGTFLTSGVLSAFAGIFKLGRRDDLLPFASSLFKAVHALGLATNPSTTSRKLNSKLVQRIGTVFLPPRLAPWRYQRGRRTLLQSAKDSLAAAAASPSNLAAAGAKGEEEEEEEYDIPEEMEEILDVLLSALKDRDTVVRWSAAKGVGRVTGRLEKGLADDVVESLVELFTAGESDGAWHGGCLALAELGRRGLLMPERLATVVPVILKALQYDELKAACSIGAHVRDAACYVFWAFARAYDPEVVRPFMDDIARGLLVATVFDREQNVRRAASAAFQENVGRQGIVPHGIDIITVTDYFAVGNRTTSFLEISVFIGQFPEYVQSLIDHLANVTLSHWDKDMRELGALALNQMAFRAPKSIAEKLRTHFVPRATSIDLNTRHGNTLAVGSTLLALSKLVQSPEELVTLCGGDTLALVAGLVDHQTKAQMFRGMGGIVLRSAACAMIRDLSLARVPLTNPSTLPLWQALIDDNIAHIEAPIQDAAVDALRALAEAYYVQEPVLHQQGVVASYLRQLAEARSPTQRRGLARAVAAFPAVLLRGVFGQVLRALTDAAAVADQGPECFAEARQSALLSLAAVCRTAGIQGAPEDGVCAGNIGAIAAVFLAGVCDYTIDSHGDVGSFVREAAMTGFETVLQLAGRAGDGCLVAPEHVREMMVHLAQQASEKIDRVRAHAGNIFVSLIHQSSPEIAHIPDHGTLREIFAMREGAFVNWKSAADAFPLVVRLLDLPTYRHRVLTGVVVSVGGLTESLVRQAGHCLMEYAVALDTDALKAFVQELVAVLRENAKNSLVIMPLFKTLELLFTNGCLDQLRDLGDDDGFSVDLLTLAKAEISKSADVNKLMGSVDVFGGLLQFPASKLKALEQLGLFLCHKFPRVRKVTAEKTYVALMAADDVIPDEHMDEVNTILTETKWEGAIADVRKVRNRIFEIVGLPIPKILKEAPAAATAGAKKSDELDSYKDLVDREGY